MSIIAIYVTYPNQELAKKICNILLKRKLIACSNIIIAESLYNWKDQIQNDQEYIAISKSIESKWLEILKVIKDNHEYDIPCIWKIKIQASPDYETWVKSVIK